MSAETPASGEAAGSSTMIFTQYYIDCLSQASYLIGDTSTGLAALDDDALDAALSRGVLGGFAAWEAMHEPVTS